MLVNNEEVFSRIDQIVERAYIDFTFDIVGADFFTQEQRTKIEGLGLILGARPLIELIYILVRMRSTEGYRKDKTLNELLDYVKESGELPIINDSSRYSIDHAKSEINEAMNDAIATTKKKVKQEILIHNNEYKNELSSLAAAPISEIPDTKEKHTKELLLGLAGLTVLLHKDFITFA